MHNKEADISQIRKYLNGELDAKAMHLLERRAQDDPFLMDALEGYGSAKTDQQKQLGELAAWLKNRIEPKKGRIIPFRVLSIAASVLIVCSAGVWWFYKDNSYSYKAKVKITNVVLQKPAAVPANLEKAPPVVIKPAEKDKIVTQYKRPAYTIQSRTAADKTVTEKPQALRELAVAQANADKSVAPATPDSTPVDEMIVTEYKAKKQADTSLFARKAASPNVGYLSPQVQQLQGKAPGVTIQSNSPKVNDLSKLAGQGNAGQLIMNQLLSNQNIQGRVIAQDDGLPIQGASVKIAGTNKVTQTDADGRFQLKADSGRDKLVIAGIGYQTRQVSANRRDSVKDISLAPSGSALSEVVVADHIPQNKEAGGETTVVNAHPKNGWAEFKKYLKANAVSPDHKNGVVKLSFMVNSYGSITAIKVIKGISPATDKKATDLLKDGPNWMPNSIKKPELVYLRIRFVN